MEYSYNYRVGEEVEVMLEELGFEDSFYPTRVVSKVASPWSYKVAYETVFYKGLLDEIVPADLLRPKPPQVPITGGFGLHEEAEAFVEDGWWAGHICGKSGPLYFFHRSGSAGETVAYALERLRVRHEWKDGRWIWHKVLVSKM